MPLGVAVGGGSWIELCLQFFPPIFREDGDGLGERTADTPAFPCFLIAAKSPPGDVRFWPAVAFVDFSALPRAICTSAAQHPNP